MVTYCGEFPATRLRRRRKDAWCRDMIAQVQLTPKDLILPLFVIEGENKTETIESMPGIVRLSIDKLVEKAKEAEACGIPAIALFPVIDASRKSEQAKEAYRNNNLIARAIKAVKSQTDNLGIIGDVALDPYTTHGHDGVLVDGQVANDATIHLLCKQALVLAKAGCDMVAPSDMMDGRVGVIRDYLDQHGFIDVQILSYAVKYASSLYAPFREAVGSTQNLKGADKKAYQMDIRNIDEAFLEVALDIQEGADMLMVKPGMFYLDMIARLTQQVQVPVLAYQVSGEYAMIKAAGQNGWIDEDKTMYESLIALKRAGATAILTYAALEVAKQLS